MSYAKLENKTSRCKSLSWEIANTLLLREKCRTLENQKNAENLVNIN